MAMLSFMVAPLRVTIARSSLFGCLVGDHTNPVRGMQEPIKGKRLNSWLERLREEDAVVDYDYNSAQGFIYRRRKKGDLDDPPIRPPKKT
jgi:hypothetical protein